jgi:hypothetical protein
MLSDAPAGRVVRRARDEVGHRTTSGEANGAAPAWRWMQVGVRGPMSDGVSTHAFGALALFKPPTAASLRSTSPTGETTSETSHSR